MDKECEISTALFLNDNMQGDFEICIKELFKKVKGKKEVGKQSQVFSSISFFPRTFLPSNSFQKLNFFMALPPENHFRSLTFYG